MVRPRRAQFPQGDENAADRGAGEPGGGGGSAASGCVAEPRGSACGVPGDGRWSGSLGRGGGERHRPLGCAELVPHGADEWGHMWSRPARCRGSASRLARIPDPARADRRVRSTWYERRTVADQPGWRRRSGHPSCLRGCRPLPHPHRPGTGRERSHRSDGHHPAHRTQRLKPAGRLRGGVRLRIITAWAREGRSLSSPKGVHKEARATPSGEISFHTSRGVRTAGPS